MTHRPEHSAPPAPASLVELARRTVEAAAEVSLAVSGLAAVQAHHDDAVLIDPCGQPIFTTRAGSPVAGAVGHAAVVTVCEARADPALVRVHLSGHLDLVHAPSAPAGASEPTVRVALTVAQVVVEYDEPGLPSVVQRVLELSAYLDFRTDAFEAAAASIISHVNKHHHVQLREFAAETAGRPVGDVVGAAVIGLDATGATLAWIDVEGWRSADLPFPRAAVRPEAMACLLRQQLTGGCHPECSS